jgi:Fe-S oxidoreductase
LHTLKNEYPAFGGNYTVIHHTQLINELVASGRLKLKASAQERLTYHDSCYLGRHNHILADPRQALRNAGAELLELPRHGMRSFCCGAGGAQMWKEEEPGSQRISANRFAEVQSTGVSTLAVACPFCMIMLTDARQTANSAIQLLDIAEVVLQAVA